MHPESTPKAVAPLSCPDADDALVRAAAGGDVAAFEALYRQHVRRIHAVVWRLIGGVDARAEELTQEAFVRAWQSLPKFRFESTFATWLHRLAVNTGLMDMRARRDSEDRENGGNALAEIRVVDHAARTAELQVDLEAAVAMLPPRARAVLILHDIEGWKHHEIAAELGMAVGSSKAQLHRARSLLREHFGDADFGHFDSDCNDHGVA
jgi:RNA polymerase sigma factor (sigma-70 family)